MEATPEFFATEGLLLDAGVIPLPSDEEMGIHFAVFSKCFFDDIKQSRDFTWAISALSQPWYASRNLQEALSWSLPSNVSATWEPLPSEPWSGHLSDLLSAKQIFYPRDAIPEVLGGDVYWDGSIDELWMLIDSPHGYIDVFTGCIVL